MTLVSDKMTFGQPDRLPTRTNQGYMLPDNSQWYVKIWGLGCRTFSPSFLLPLLLPFCLRPWSDRSVLNDIVIETVACTVRWLIDKD